MKTGNELWLEMNAAIDALTPDAFRAATVCPRCAATGLKAHRALGRRFLNEDNGQPHKCADIIAAFKAQFEATREDRRKLAAELEKFGDGGTILRYSDQRRYHYTPGGCVEFY